MSPQENTTAQQSAPSHADAQPRKQRRSVWPFLVVGILVLAFIGAVLWRILKPSPLVTTDDARVAAHYTIVAPRVSGQVRAVHVDDNERVKAGQILVELDLRDLKTAVRNAQAALERDAARVSDVSASIVRQPSLVRQAQSMVPAAEAGLSLAQANATRYTNLATTGAGTLQNRQQAESALQQAQAELDGAKAALQAQQEQLAVLEADRVAAQAQVRSDQAALEQARLNLSYGRIVAPLDGVVGERTIQVGDYVVPGSPLMSVVPLEEVYIDANYREVELRNVKPGQRARIHIDTYNIDLDGVVDSIAPASGATFAAIPPENATGNFTKIVQRLTVKIRVAPDHPLIKLLRVGMSVETSIDTTGARVVEDQQHRASTEPPVIEN
jgi:membrane fusion protein (multidrug efflux system)